MARGTRREFPGAAPARAFEGRSAGEERTVEGVRFCRAPAGRFRMGSPETEAGRRADEGPVEVTLRRGFWMGKFEVTQGQWAAVCGAFPRARDKGVGDDSPVHWVRYAEAEEFCRRLTERAVGTLPRGWAIRLPTEAQWESACRAGTRTGTTTGTTTATAFGERRSGRDANIGRLPYGGGEAAPALGRASQVGSYPANAWGLCDMHENEWEWCRDWYHARLPGGLTRTFPGRRRRRTGTGPIRGCGGAGPGSKPDGRAGRRCGCGMSRSGGATISGFGWRRWAEDRKGMKMLNRRQVPGVLSAPGQHWVGDGFPVRSLFDYNGHGRMVSPFLLRE